MCEVLLYRQITPMHVDDGEILFTAFKPRTDDHGELSVDKSTLITPQEAFRVFNANTKGKKSVGVSAVSEQECGQLNLPVIDSPTKGHLSHASIVFSNLSDGQIKIKAIQLAKKANNRGWQYLAEN